MRLLPVLVAGTMIVAAGTLAVASIAGAGSHETNVRAEPVQLDEEIAAWHRVLAVDSTSAIALTRLAALHLQRSRERNDWNDVLAAGELARQSLGIRFNRNGAGGAVLFSSLMAQHRFAEARAIADTLVMKFPDEPAYRAMLGEAAMELGQYDAAGQAFSSLRSPTSHLSIAGRTARWAEVSGDLAAARHIIRIARDAAVERFDVTLEQRSWFRMRYADIERRSGRPRLARKELEAALLENPTDRRLMMTMARHALADDDVGRATELAEDAMDVSLDADVLVLLCRAALAAGDSMRVEELEGALMTMVTGAGPSVHRSVDLYLLDRGRDVEEILARARASLVERHDVYGWDLYAWALYRAGRIADASSASSIALSLRTADPALYERAAVIARAAGYVEHAKALELRAERLGGA